MFNSLIFSDRFTTGRTETPNAASTEERGVAGHVHVAKEVRPFDVIGDDGPS